VDPTWIAGWVSGRKREGLNGKTLTPLNPANKIKQTGEIYIIHSISGEINEP